MLPQDGNEHEHRGDKDQGEGDLRDWSRWEGFHLSLRSSDVDFFVPARKGSKEDEGDESEDDGNDAETEVSYRFATQIRKRALDLHEVWEDYGVLEGTCHPDQIQRVLVHTDQLRQCRCVLVAHEGPTIGLYANAEISNTDFESCLSDDVGDCCADTRVDLSRAESRWIRMVVERY